MSMGSSRSIAPITLAVVVSLASAVPSASRAQAAAPDPCAMLTPVQVGDVLGVKVGDGRHLASKACEWSASGATGAASKKVTLTFQDARAFDYAKMPVAAGGITKTPVTGVGDDAVFGTTPNVATVLTVKKGAIVFVIRVYGFPLDPTKDKEKALALAVLSKL